ncbi:MAG: M13 family metallopeptidase [Bacteroidota bacterium]|jgi:putative endopeptidase
MKFKFLFVSAFMSLTVFSQNKYGVGIDLSIIDKKADPKQDFARYASGLWDDKANIPPTESSWGSFSEIRERNEKNLLKIIQEVSADKSAPEGSERKKIQDLWNSSMDSVSRNKNGIKPLKKEFDLIESIKTKDEFIQAVAKLNLIGVNSVLGFYIYIDFKNSNVNRPYLSQGGIALPSKDYYLSPNYAEIQNKYKEHISRTLKMVKVKSKNASSTVYEIEKQLASASMSLIELRDVEKQYNKYSSAELTKICPSVNFNLYFKQMGMKTPDTIIVQQPEFYKRLSKLMDSIPMDSWKTYLKWTLIHEMQPYLSDDLVKEQFSFYGTVMTGQKEMRPRWRRSLSMVDAALGEALGKLFVEKHFNADAKRRVNEMVDNLVLAFKDRINNRPWMSEETKKVAVQKLDKVTRKLGYPDKWQDYSKMKISATDFVRNVIEVNIWKSEDMLADLNRAPDKTKWGMTPPTVNAYYNPSTNEITFPAGIMQPPFFDPNADDAFNYGIMGAVIGHELSHGFDDEGSNFDGDGNFKTWWAEEDVERFKVRTEKLVSQYDNYVAIDTFHVKGRLTLGENIADLGGLTMAYYAYKKSLQGKASEVRDGLTGEQRFFISWAQGWKTKMRDNYLKQMVATNPHSPARFRAMGPLTNMPEFYEAFGVKEGDKMYKSKEDRVEIW